MDSNVLEKLYADGNISAATYTNIRSANAEKLLSLHWEIKTLLYLGVLLLTSGLGILVYKNIDTIGHQAILLFIALICAGSFYYCFRHRSPYTAAKVTSPSILFDYILLLACTSFVIFIAYLQWQYHAFGDRYGAATFLPMVMLFFCAYYFDHLGILAMAITTLAAWLGLTITPVHILESNDFNNSRIIFTGLLIGVLLLSLGFFSKYKKIKSHFEFTYNNFGIHVLLISLIEAMIHFDNFYAAWFLLLVLICALFYRWAAADRSFYFILVVAFYAYIGAGYVFICLINRIDNIGLRTTYIGIIYFIASATGLVSFLIKTNKKLKIHDSL